MNKAKHIAWIDHARTLTMLLVIIGHCTYTKLMTQYGGIDYFDDVSPSDYSFSWKILCLIVAFIYSFHMPLFMMLSGACFRLGIKKTNGFMALINNKCHRLLIPFFLTTLLLSVPLKYLGGYYNESEHVMEDILLGQFLLMGNSHLWFIVSLFWIFILFYGLYKVNITEKRWLLPFLILLSLIASYLNELHLEFLGIILAFKHLVYFSIGFIYLNRLDSSKMGGVKMTVHFICLIILFVVYWKFGHDNDIIIKCFHYIQSIIMGIYGSFVMIQFSKAIETKRCITESKFYKTFLRYSYDFYLFSDPFNYVLIYIMTVYFGVFVIGNVTSLTAFFVRFVGSIVFAYAIILIKNKIQEFRNINGTIRKS